ncbi:L-serine ammonia-lyase [Planctomycetes bacterium K23_9]|uniref:L-serine dehydratase n=1 Tax=Stieleria marina TaxID=1930275 RepID=A0A517NSX1_9BACT|nr:L-serine dehydratase 2 [Planctomycetes bacterium K23_9]
MQRISIFEMFKIGVGPSSSHTMGPWRAAQRFVAELTDDQKQRVDHVRVDLFGSLAKTGKGHGTDLAVMWGLMNEDPETVAVDSIFAKIETVTRSQSLRLGGSFDIPFDPTSDIVFHFDQTLPFHPNGLTFKASCGSTLLYEATYYSIGGGFVVTEADSGEVDSHSLPFPIDHAVDLLQHCEAESASIAQIVRRNELTWRDADDVKSRLRQIRDVMTGCIHRGVCSEGILPGGLNVHRRAAKMAKQLLQTSCSDNLDRWVVQVGEGEKSFQRILDWVSCFALAVNEENAAFGRVVTAPTNGAAGVIPAVMMYGKLYCDFDDQTLDDFLLVAGEIGCLFKKNATISAAMGGCQAEIGVSSAMAAAALTECLGGTPPQAAEAAEIAMEHHLGMTCDPIAGLVQIPCIERNAMGAIKAITAAQMALQRDVSRSHVSLDDVIQTMWQTAQDMNAKYKETSEGGLAIQISVNVSEC